MLGAVRTVLDTIRTAGLRYTVVQIAIRLLALPAGLAFGIYTRITSQPRRDVAIVIRGDRPESDTFALLDELATSATDRHCHILSRHPVDCEPLVPWLERGVTVTTPRPHTREWFQALARSQLVCCKYDDHLRWYRRFDPTNRQYVRLYHGPITKAYGETTTRATPSRGIHRSVSNALDRVVESTVEKYFRAAAEARHPSQFHTYGYPRFDRIRRLREGTTTPVLPTPTHRLFADADTTDVLYASTHKDGVYETTFVPYPDADPDRLRSWCHDNAVRLFLRPHPIESPRLDHLVDGETILLADQTVATAATELLSLMDGLVTDYSSIYIEYLPFDRPIVFVPDDHERFLQVRGLAFEYDRYFPGPKPQTFEEFLSALGSIVEGDDGYADGRAFVRETFAPARDHTFLDAILEANAHRLDDESV